MDARVELYWMPLGAGGSALVRWNGRAFEAVAARFERRPPHVLFHCALQVHLDAARWSIEMAPVWSTPYDDRGAVCSGPVGMPWLGRWRWFRYEVRCWRNGVIPDLDHAVESPRLLPTDPDRAQAVLELTGAFPTATWGRDELRAGEMWNSNSLVSWLLLRSGHDVTAVTPPVGGRAPGWAAGLVVAQRAGTALASVR